MILVYPYSVQQKHFSEWETAKNFNVQSYSLESPSLILILETIQVKSDISKS